MFYPNWKNLRGIMKNHVIISTYPIPMRMVTIVEGEFAVVPKSSASRSTLASIPTKGTPLPKMLLRSLMREMTTPAPITPLRPASLVTMKSTIPTKGMTAATMDPILVVRLSTT